jgi:hypothetical protein
MSVGPALNSVPLRSTGDDVYSVFEGKQSRERVSGKYFLYPLGSWVLLIAMAVLSLYAMRPPAAVSSQSSPGVFSAERAMKHLEVIARNPRPIGSAEHERVRKYIVDQLAAQGFETAVSTSTALGRPEYKPFRVATVQNITGRLRGTAGGKAVMLVGHYDSVPTGPGASDDGAAVAAFLETARALKAGPPLKNDVIILLTDGEEIGLMGASAFVNEQRSEVDVGAAFNFEARGASGQSVVFETSDQNGWLIQQFAAASPAPVGNSLMYEIYKRLPNDTDFSTLKRAGFAGLNFAYINDLSRYHTATDNIQNLDVDSLQHHGANALALARHFGNLDFESAKGNEVYFNPLGSTFVHYPEWLVIPLALVVLLAFVSVAVIGFRKRSLTWRGIAFGFLMLPLSGVISYLAVTVGLWLVKTLNKGAEDVPWGEPYNSSYYVLSLMFVSFAAVLAVYMLFRKRARVSEVAMGALFWWVILALLSSVLLPGGSYLFVWPLLFALVGAGIYFVVEGQRPSWTMIVYTLCAVPGLLLFVPMIHTLFAALTFNAAGMILLLFVLLLGLLIPSLEVAVSRMKWRVPAVALLFTVALIVAGLLNSGFDANHPKMSSVFYGLNADNGQAVWASFDSQPDEWTSQFFPGGGRMNTLADLIPTSRSQFLQSEAPAATLAPPELTSIGEETQGDTRLIRLRVTSPRGAEIVSLYPEAGAEVMGISVNGKTIDPKGVVTNKAQGPWGLQYYGLPQQGAEVTFQVKSSQPIKIRVTDRSYGLPQLPGLTLKPRPDYMILPPTSTGEMTMVGKTFNF